MKIKYENIKLTGKGFFAEENQEWLDDNLKIVSPGVEFHEVIYDDIDKQYRIGWLVMGKLCVIADFTTHTEKGMVGRSVEDNLIYSLIYDPKDKLKEYVSEDLQEVSLEKSQKLLKKYFVEGTKLTGNIQLDKEDEDDVLVIISISSHLVFVQNVDASIRVGSSEVMVLSKKESRDKLTIISQEDGILHIGEDKSISIGGNKIIINGKDFSPEKIVKTVSNALSNALYNINFDFK